MIFQNEAASLMALRDGGEVDEKSCSGTSLPQLKTDGNFASTFVARRFHIPAHIIYELARIAGKIV